MKIIIIAITLFLISGCEELGVDHNEAASTFSEVQQNNDPKIEQLLVSLELEVGLGNLKEAMSIYNQLNRLLENETLTDGQQARLHTLSNWLSDLQVGSDTQRHFTGSDAVAIVINTFGVAPDGYQLVYHEVPSFVGSNGLGYYVFLTPLEAEIDNILETFFVTDRGRILSLN